MVNIWVALLAMMGRLQVPPFAPALLAGLLMATIAIAGCLGSPSDDMDLDHLPSEQEASHNQQSEAGHHDEDTFTPQEHLPETDAVGAFDPYANESESPDEKDDDVQENGTFDRASYVGPPVVKLNLLTTDGQPAKNLTTPAPHNATIHLDGYLSGNATPYWTLHLGSQLLDDGTKLPKTLEHQFVTPGSHTLTLQLYDGRTRTHEQIHLEIQRPDPPAPIHFNDTITGAWTPEHGYIGEQNAHPFQLGVPVTRITANLTGDATAADLDFELIAPDGTTAGRHVNFNEPSGALFPAQEAPIIITDPEYTTQLGEWTLHVKPAASISGSYTLDVTFE